MSTQIATQNNYYKSTWYKYTTDSDVTPTKCVTASQFSFDLEELADYAGYDLSTRTITLASNNISGDDNDYLVHTLLSDVGLNPSTEFWYFSESFSTKPILLVGGSITRYLTNIPIFLGYDSLLLTRANNGTGGSGFSGTTSNDQFGKIFGGRVFLDLSSARDFSVWFFILVTGAAGRVRWIPIDSPIQLTAYTHHILQVTRIEPSNTTIDVRLF